MTDYDIQYVASVLRKLTSLNYIQPGEVPNINLYMDQVTAFMDAHLSDGKRHESDKILTKTMINNYTKNDLLPPPEKKKYSKDHIYMLTYIYYLKNLLSISDIQSLLTPLTQYAFGKDESEGKSDMDMVYEQIHKMCQDEGPMLAKDIMKKSHKADHAFSDIEDEEERNFLKIFSLVSMLSFDVYIKKNMIQAIIDDYTSSNKPSNKASKSSSKKKKD